MRSKAVIALLAAAAVLSGPVVVDKSALAENTDQAAAMDEGTYLIQPRKTPPGYMLPPLSDHLLVAQLNDAQFAVEEGGFEKGDGTAKEYNRGYYAEPVQIVEFVPAPSFIESIEPSRVSDDGTAQQYDRGYYKDPETIVAMIIVSSDDIENIED